VVIALSQGTFAVGIVAVLLALFFLLLVSSLIRARRAGGEAPGAPAAGRGAQQAPAARSKAVLSRRDFFRGGLLASLGVFTAQFGGASLAFLWPNLKGGFGSVIHLPDPPDAILNQISSNRQPYYYGAGRFYVINYKGDAVNTLYAGLTAAVSEGRLMAIYQKCAHLGCRVPFCQQSQWFECPCHGSKYSYAGEYELGPAPKGLSRFKITVSGSTVTVDTSTIIDGPPRGTNTIHQAPEGPFCVGAA